MKSIVKSLLALSLLLSLPLGTGCGKSSNPMAPEAPAAKEYIDVTVTLVSVTAVHDGDEGIFDGAGEFKFEALVNDGPGPLVVSADWWNIDEGSTAAINKSKVMRIEKDAPYNIQVKFTATEWDWTILNQQYADSRMDNIWEERIHRNGSSRPGFNDGERWITLGTDNNLQLRLIYTVTSKPVV